MIKVFKNTICLVLAIIIAVYTIICNVWMTFSFSMNCVLFTAVILLILMNYIINFPVNKEARGPSFPRVLAQVVTVFYFLGIISIMLFNILYPKYHINENDQKYDYIIVFGAGISQNKNEIMNSRIEKAIEYMTEIDGIYQHDFLEGNKEKSLCFICKKRNNFI